VRPESGRTEVLRCQERRRTTVLDLVFVIVTIALFGGLALILRGVERL
jgi:hypothetical protein